MVMSSMVSGPWKKKLIVQRFLFSWKVCGRFWCEKWSEVVWMETMNRHSVLSSFSLSLSDVIHVFTSEMQSCMLWTQVSIWSGRQELCSWVSSAKDWLEMECRPMSVVRGFVYKMTKTGPRTEPCEMPKLSRVGCESLLLMVTVWVLLERWVLNQLRGAAEVP